MSESQNSFNQTPVKLKRLKKRRDLSDNQGDPDEDLFNNIETDDLKLKKAKKQVKMAKRLLDMFQEGHIVRESAKKPKLKKINKVQQIETQKTKDQGQEIKQQKVGKIKLLQTKNPLEQTQKTKMEILQKNQQQKENDEDEQFSIEEESEGSQKNIKPKDESKKKSTKKCESSEYDSQEYSEQSYSSYSEGGHKKRMVRKKEILKRKTAEKMKEWQNKFSVEQKEDQNQKETYYTGMEFGNGRYGRKDKNMVKSKNKMFQQFNLMQHQLQEEEREQNKQEQPEQHLDIKLTEVKKQITQFKFLSKASSIKKTRGTTENKAPTINPTSSVASIEPEQIDKQTVRNKQSLAKLMSTSSFKEEQEISLSVRIPCVSRGKSTDVFNSTLFLKKMSCRQQQPDKIEEREEYSQQIGRKSIKLSREEMLRSMYQSIQSRKSKYISQEEIKNSFKKTDLHQLEEDKKRIQEQRMKQDQMLVGPADDSSPDQSFVPQAQTQQAEAQVNQNQNQNENNEANKIQTEDQKKNKPIDQEQYRKLLAQQEQQVEQQVEQQAEESSGQVEQEQQEQIEIDEEDKQNVSAQPIDVEAEEADGEYIQQKSQRNVEQNAQNQQNEQLKQFNRIKKTFSFEENEKQDISKDKLMFRKLKKLATKIAQKRKKKEDQRKKMEGYFDEEAEVGSDNQENDMKKKIIDREAEQKEYQGQNLDAQLEELIDNAVYLNQSDQQQAFQKYLRDQRIRDQEELRKVLLGEFRTKKGDDNFKLMVGEDQRLKEERLNEVISKMKRMEDDDNNMYGNDKNEDQQNNQKPENNEEPNEFIRAYEVELKKIKTATSRIEQMAIFNEPTMKKPASENLNNSKLILTKRNSLLNLGGDKTRISSFTQDTQKNSKGGSTLNKLYQKSVTASRSIVVFAMGKSKLPV